MVKRVLTICVILIFTKYSPVFGEFIGPTELIYTTFGSGNGQIGFESGDTEDLFAWKFAISPTGKIAIFDEVNSRVIIFNSAGEFERNINRLSIGAAFDSSDSLYLEAKFRKFDSNGIMIFEKNVGYDKILITKRNEIFGYDRKNRSYTLYSPSGELLKTTNERPVELGLLKSQKKLSDVRYLTVIEFNDKTFSVIAPNMLESFSRDISGYLYGTIKSGSGDNQHYRVYKYSTCGKMIGSLDLPSDNVIVEPPSDPSQPTSDITLIAEYGKPVIGPNGDVYTWKRIPGTYSILKWTWQDDPKSNKDDCKQ